ncbi:MAG: hypothetical protein ABF479_10580 [Gluconacetobacter sp.]
MKLGTLLWRALRPAPVRDLKRAVNVDGIRSTSKLLHELAGEAQGDTVLDLSRTSAEGRNVVPFPGARPEIETRTGRLIRSSAYNCYIFLTLFTVVLVCSVAVMLFEWRMFSFIAMFDLGWLELIFLLGFFKQAVGNWLLRRGAPGSLLTFLCAGRDAWPRLP